MNYSESMAKWKSLKPAQQLQLLANLIAENEEGKTPDASVDILRFINEAITSAMMPKDGQFRSFSDFEVTMDDGTIVNGGLEMFVLDLLKDA